MNRQSDWTAGFVWFLEIVGTGFLDGPVILCNKIAAEGNFYRRVRDAAPYENKNDATKSVASFSEFS